MKRAFLLLPLLLAAAAPVAAQDRAGTVEISPFGGAYLGGRLERGSNAIFDHSVDVADSGTFGLRLGYNVNRRFGIEASWAHARADIREIGSQQLFGSDSKVGRFTVDQYEMNAVLNMARGRVVPYFTIGAGATTFQVSTPTTSSSTDTRFAANLGLGVKVFLVPRVALRFEGRGRSAYISTGDCDRSHDDGCRNFRSNDNRWYTSGEVTGGMTVAF